MRTNIRILKEVALKYGLEISNQKSKVLPVRGKCDVQYIEDIEVVDEMKYLGVTVRGSERRI